MLCFILRLLLFTQVSHQDRIFIYVPYKLSQPEAKRYCRERHTDLASFRNAAELAALQTPCETTDYCWIGLQRVAHGSPDFVWSDGETNGFRQWHSGEPNNEGGTENCVAMAKNEWYDTVCHQQFLDFLCYEDEPILAADEKTWEEALEDCRALHLDPYSSLNYFKHVYDLYQIRSGNFTSLANRVIAGAQTQEVWIGLRFLAGEWLWLNDNPLDIQLPDCPAAANYCSTITKSGQIQLSNCSDSKNFFCSRN